MAVYVNADEFCALEISLEAPGKQLQFFVWCYFVVQNPWLLVHLIQTDEKLHSGTRRSHTVTRQSISYSFYFLYYIISIWFAHWNWYNIIFRVNESFLYVFSCNSRCFSVYIEQVDIFLRLNIVCFSWETASRFPMQNSAKEKLKMILSYGADTECSKRE